MPNPRDLRDMRLRNEYKEIMRINGNIIKVEPLDNEPHEKYRITFNIRTIINAAPTYSEKTICLLTLPPNYPNAPPSIRPETPPPLNRTWHHGSWCVGLWNREESLVSCIIRCARTLQCDPTISGYDSNGTYYGKDVWEQANFKKELVLNNSRILAALEKLESITILSKSKPKIEIRQKAERPKITIMGGTQNGNH